MHNTASVRTEESERANLKPGVRAMHLSGSQSALEPAAQSVGRSLSFRSQRNKRSLSRSRISAFGVPAEINRLLCVVSTSAGMCALVKNGLPLAKQQAEIPPGLIFFSFFFGVQHGRKRGARALLFAFLLNFCTRIREE